MGRGRKKPVKGNQNILDELKLERKKNSGGAKVSCFLIQRENQSALLQLAVLHGD